MTNAMSRYISLWILMIISPLWADAVCAARGIAAGNDYLYVRCASGNSVEIASGYRITQPLFSQNRQFVVFLAGSSVLSDFTIAKSSKNWKALPLVPLARIRSELVHRKVQDFCLSADGGLVYALIDFSATSFYLVGVDIERMEIIMLGPAASFSEIIHGPFRGNLVLQQREPVNGDLLGRAVVYVYNRFSRDGKLLGHFGTDKDKLNKIIGDELIFYP